MVDVTYGLGKFQCGDQTHQGRIILGTHKLYLRSGNDDIVDTYVPLDKIISVRLRNNATRVDVKPTLYFQYTVVIEGERKDITALVLELVKRRGFKKQWLRRHWIERNE